MIRLLLTGIHVLRTGEVLVDVGPLRSRLLSVRDGSMPFPSVAAWAADLREEPASAASDSTLAAGPDLPAVDQLLARVREEGLK